MKYANIEVVTSDIKQTVNELASTPSRSEAVDHLRLRLEKLLQVAQAFADPNYYLAETFGSFRGYVEDDAQYDHEWLLDKRLPQKITEIVHASDDLESLRFVAECDDGRLREFEITMKHDRMPDGAYAIWYEYIVRLPDGKRSILFDSRDLT